VINIIKTYILNLFNKNNNNNMITEERLISYKQNFTGKEFQWIKTDRPELIGKIVKCRDITPNGVVMFNDGSQVSVKDLNNKLMMIHGDAQPLSKAEVEAISPFKNKTNPTPKLTPPPTHADAKVSPEYSNTDVRTGLDSPKQPKVNPFEMFNSDETDLNIKLSIKLPDKKLLKMMYNNAEDKDEFIRHLSDYVGDQINSETIKSSLSGMLAPVKKTAKDSINIKFTEVKNGK
jgi:hypothetical protein